MSRFVVLLALTALISARLLSADEHEHMPVVNAPALHDSAIMLPTISDRPPPRDVVIFVVRHAEKSVVQLGDDPTLSPAGEQRALELRHVLGDTRIDRVFVTHFRRSRETALPLARALGDSLEVVDDTEKLLLRLMKLPPGTRALVVGHSDTVPDIVAGLTGVKPPPYESGEWDRLYQVSWTRRGEPTLTLLRYGAPRATAASSR